MNKHRSGWLAAVGVAIVAATSLLVVPPVGAEVTTLTADPPSGPAGVPFTMSGETCDPGAMVTFFWAPSEATEIIGTTSAAGDGSFSGTAVIPESADPGPTLVGAQCEDLSATYYIDYEITEAGPTTTEAPTTTAPATPSAVAPATVAAPRFTG